jgi:hypothetical protein
MVRFVVEKVCRDWRGPVCIVLLSLGMIAAGVESCPAARAADFARADDIRIGEPYRAKVRPGYCCWVCLWRDAGDGVYLSFVEKRRSPNPDWEPVPLDFWESMGLPHGYHTSLSSGSKEIVYEIVVLKSADNAATWLEIGRNRARVDNSFSWASLADGGMLRSQSNDYVAWHKGDRQQTWCETSRDGGTTWTRRAVIFQGHNGSGSPHRLRRLRDGTLVQLISAMPEFGPGKERFSRHTKRPNVRQELSVFLYFSKDDGRTWSGPLPVLPGVLAYEPDFIEFPSGDVLILNSNVQGGPQVRQYLRQTDQGWIPGPVFDVVSGRVPETVALTKTGLLVGAVRGGEFSCSNDDGANWHTVAGIKAGYQPYLIDLSDGRLLCGYHTGGGDEPFGQRDLSVETAAFRLTANLPSPTRLRLTRNLDAKGNKYTNSYTAVLTSGEQPIAGKTIRFKYAKRYGGGGETTAATDVSGRAKIDLGEDFKGVTDIHLSYTLQATFVPEANDKELAPCESDLYTAYAITSSRADLGHPEKP